MPVDSGVMELAQGANFAVLGTYLPSGDVLSHVMWIDADKDHIIFNTEPQRLKFRNIERDPRVSIVILDAKSPYRYAEIRGEVVSKELGAAAREHIDALSMKYNGQPYDDAWIQTERVMVKVKPKRQNLRG